MPRLLKQYIKRSVTQARLPAIAKSVKRNNLTYLSDAKLLSLAQTVQEIKKRRIAGDFVEYGVALGGSAIYLASEIDFGRRFLGFDVFGMIPAPSERDDEKSMKRYEVISSGKSAGIGGDRYYGYEENLYEKVCGLFEKFGHKIDGVKICLHKGMFHQTVEFSDQEKIALAHVDCDWHDSVMFCLEATARNLSVFGKIILDDYNDYGGCRLAVDEFLKRRSDFRIVKTTPHAVLEKITSK